MTGDTSPRGLYTEFIIERTPLHVKGFTGSETEGEIVLLDVLVDPKGALRW